MPGSNGVPKGSVVDLDVLFQVRKVRLDGKEIAVAPLDGVSYQKLNELTKNGQPRKGEDLLVMYDVAKQCLPDVPEDRVMKMSAPQIGALIGVAQSSIDEVEASIPKRRAPGKASSAPA
jgi:hypothetical protein